MKIQKLSKKNFFNKIFSIKKFSDRKSKIIFIKKINKNLFKKYFTILVREAKLGRLYEGFGRDEELNLILEILLCKQKNCIMLVGDTGIGKTTLVELLAYKIAKQNIPFIFFDTEIIKIDFKSIFQNFLKTSIFFILRLKLMHILKIFSKNPNFILFVENFEKIYELFNYNLEDFLNINLNKKQFKKTELVYKNFTYISFKCIATCTTNHYTKFFKEFSSLKRFIPIKLCALSQAQIIKILTYYKPILEQHHNVKYNSDTLISSIKYSSTITITELEKMNLLDKSLNILDRTGARNVLMNTTQNLNISHKNLYSLYLKKFKYLNLVEFWTYNYINLYLNTISKNKKSLTFNINKTIIIPKFKIIIKEIYEKIFHTITIFKVINYISKFTNNSYKILIKKILTINVYISVEQNPFEHNIVFKKRSYNLNIIIIIKGDTKRRNISYNYNNSKLVKNLFLGFELNQFIFLNNFIYQKNDIVDTFKSFIIKNNIDTISYLTCVKYITDQLIVEQNPFEHKILNINIKKEKILEYYLKFFFVFLFSKSTLNISVITYNFNLSIYNFFKLCNNYIYIYYDALDYYSLENICKNIIITIMFKFKFFLLSKFNFNYILFKNKISNFFQNTKTTILYTYKLIQSTKYYEQDSKEENINDTKEINKKENDKNIKNDSKEYTNYFNKNNDKKKINQDDEDDDEIEDKNEDDNEIEDKNENDNEIEDKNEDDDEIEDKNKDDNEEKLSKNTNNFLLTSQILHFSAFNRNKFIITTFHINKFIEDLGHAEKMINQNFEFSELENLLSQVIVGQKLALKTICKTIKRGLFGIKKTTRPVASFLFTGPTGVGKTEVCKTLATVLYNDENHMLRYDMSEFGEAHSISRLIGAPPGYIGYEEDGELIKGIKETPSTIVLFDELEKAHIKVPDLLLQVLEDGRLTSSKKELVSFAQAILVATSNEGISKVVPMLRTWQQEKEQKMKIIINKEPKILVLKKAVKIHPFQNSELNNIVIFQKLFQFINEKKINRKNNYDSQNNNLDFVESLINSNLNVHKINLRTFIYNLSSFEKKHINRLKNFSNFLEKIKINYINYIKKEKLQLQSHFNNEFTFYNFINCKFTENFLNSIENKLIILWPNIAISENLYKKFVLFSFLNNLYINETNLIVKNSNLFLPYLTNVALFDEKNLKNYSKIIAKKQKEVVIEMPELIMENLLTELQKRFRAEFLNRFNNIILFEPLNDEAMSSIYDIHLEKTIKLMLENGINLIVDSRLKHSIISTYKNNELGARPIRRAIEDTIDDAVTDAVLLHQLNSLNFKKSKMTILIKGEDLQNMFASILKS